MNHRWKDNKCIHCGLTREKKLRTRVVRTYSKLTRSGIFEDRPVYDEHIVWWYGDKHKFERPECKRSINQQTEGK